MSLLDLKYPIGEFKKPKNITASLIKKNQIRIEKFAKKLKKEVKNLSDIQLDTPYRPDGWTIRQVVHHCADSHANSFIRIKLALTEDNPTIKPYLENHWAELKDSKNFPIKSSLMILEGIHERWTILLQSLSEVDLKKTYFHPELKKNIPLEEVIMLYGWHCEHHLAHITQLKKSKNWK